MSVTVTVNLINGGIEAEIGELLRYRAPQILSFVVTLEVSEQRQRRQQSPIDKYSQKTKFDKVNQMC